MMKWEKPDFLKTTYEFKKDKGKSIYRVIARTGEGDTIAGPRLFSFDGKKIYNLFGDYPDKMTKEQVALLRKEYPEVVEFFDEGAEPVKDEKIIKQVTYCRWAAGFKGFLEGLFYKEDPRVKDMDWFDVLHELQTAESKAELPDELQDLVTEYDKKK